MAESVSKLMTNLNLRVLIQIQSFRNTACIELSKVDLYCLFQPFVLYASVSPPLRTTESSVILLYRIMEDEAVYEASVKTGFMLRNP